MKIKRCLLLWFPQNEYLEDKWWHRLFEVLAIIVSSLAILILVLGVGAYILDDGYCYSSYRGSYYCGKNEEPLLVLILAPIMYFSVTIVYKVLLYIFLSKNNTDIKSSRNGSYIIELEKLGQLKEKGIITNEEFREMKKKLLK